MSNPKEYGDKVEQLYSKLVSIDSRAAGVKLSEDKWSVCEIVGHLIDSASNNHQRFVRLQFDDLLDFPGYDAEPWVQKQSYKDMSYECLVALWYNYNCLLLHVIENIKEAAYENLWVKDEDTSITLEEMIHDYYKHMDLHKDQLDERIREVQDYIKTL